MMERELPHQDLVQITNEEFFKPTEILKRRFPYMYRSGAGLVPLEIDEETMVIRARDFGFGVQSKRKIRTYEEATEIVLGDFHTHVPFFTYSIGGRMYLGNFQLDRFMDVFMGREADDNR